MQDSLKKYMLKSGKSKLEIAGVLKSAGQKHESPKLKEMTGKNDHANGEMPVKPPAKGSHSGEMSKVKDDGAKDSDMSTPSEFGPADYGSKKKKKPAYLD